ncbi:hypothetical protein RhiirA5_366065 [Rhizophagus irregularis]|uniref:F-box domain-containing protein n=5 Tax=Rhizophagus irregularis TaxID=588596 RepID=A0A2I1E6L0_9GLOM|nr:hypothetical protein RirG_268850 [Rhizophagus irregularis DAOM 197198w]PKB99896.1 hypothetical protein RhiirA5_366065 [Rhizophagus irregularis]GET56805.1 hypothetical protein GLOIN_2v1615883 [Rhizophagus irregularis DAOM 181602=DAOM 197198]PKC60796.1 hypothetical protein RhiirA1_425549 [Rhizophagus irregularis]PKY17767.1 hypothetical protein RhiirB3_430456 [Rhizophagus irregularis]
MSLYLPTELLDKIFSSIDGNDIKTLHSCILVNRVWCNTMIPYLWKSPFHLAIMHQTEKLVPAYFPFFSKEAKHILQLHIPSTSPIFDYPMFLRELDFNEVYLLIRKWCDFKNNATNKFIGFEVFKQRGRQTLLLLQELSKLFMLKCNKLENLSLDTRSIRYGPYGNLAECMLLTQYPGASHCLAPLKKFVSRGSYDKDAIFRSMVHYCKNIDEMIIEDNDSTESESLVNLITSQKRLQKFTIGNWWGSLSKILKSLGNQWNSLIYVEIHGCHFYNYLDDSSTFEGLICCKNLETLKIEDCYNLTNDIMKPLGNTIFPKLHTLYFSNYRVIDDDLGDHPYQGIIQNNDQNIPDHPYLALITIIKNSNATLRNVRLNMDLVNYPNIISICATYCPNITYYKARIQNHSEMNQLLQLLKSCTQLEQLEITAEKWDSSVSIGLPWEIDLFFPEIGKLLPKTLKYFDIDGWSCTPLGLSNFLKNCNVDIKRMSWMCYISSADYLDVIEKYAKLKGRKVNGHREKKEWGLNLTLIVDFD